MGYTSHTSATNAAGTLSIWFQGYKKRKKKLEPGEALIVLAASGH